GVASSAPAGKMYAFLILPDGGKVKFLATQNSLNGQWFYKYRAVAIIDPHGLETTLTWENYGNGKKRLTRVTEPAGRYLQFSYANPNNQRISQVQEFINGLGRRTVQYNYPAGYLWLGSVVYYGNANWTARYQYVAPSVGGEDMPPLLWTCDDPIYPGPMHKIAYTYRTADNYTGNHAVYGQISSENYYDGTNVGAAVSTLTVPSATTRTETRGDGKTRTFTYTTDGYLLSCTDFYNHSASQNYDGYRYINYVIDRNGHRTDFTNDIVTGNVLQVQFPLTTGDTPGQGNARPTINYTYTNNYYLHTIQGENGQITTITRDGNNRASRIDYPDGGDEAFAYDATHFYQLSSHRMITGGTETFAYDGFHRLQYYSDPYHRNSGNPSIQYFYEGHDWVNGVLDALNHPINWEYNDRGQVTLTRLGNDPNDGIRHTITSAYNLDGTLQGRTDQLGHMTSYSYDDYRRLKSVTPPVRGYGDNSQHTTHFYYDVNGVGDDYRYTDSNLSWVVPSSGKKTKTVYDDNRRKSSVTVAYGRVDAATTSYGYDNVGNLRSITNPLNHNTVPTLYL